MWKLWSYWDVSAGEITRGVGEVAASAHPGEELVPRAGCKWPHGAGSSPPAALRPRLREFHPFWPQHGQNRARAQP